MASYMLTPVVGGGGGGAINIETTFEISGNGNKSYLCCANAPVLTDNSSPLVGSDPKIISTHNEEYADLSDHSPPLLVSDSEPNQSSQSQKPHLLSSSEDEVESSFNSSN